jgi:protein involved in polysaccharide export with SLBB domain
MSFRFQLDARVLFRVLAWLVVVALPLTARAQQRSSLTGLEPVAPPVALPVAAATPMAAGAAGASTVAPAIEQPVSYVLRVNDLVRVAVFQEDDLTTEARISKSGSITLPLIGPVQVDGRTVAAAIEDIRERLDRDYVINPQVTLTVLEYAQQSVTVLGEVQKPGQIQIPPEGGLDLLGAIALAGGYTRIADPSRVIIRRMVDGRDVVLQADAKRLARDAHVQPFFVQPGDRISVAQSIW